MTIPAPGALSDRIRGKAFSGSLTPTVVGRAELFSGRVRALLLLESGQADLRLPGAGVELTGPCLSWTPWEEGARMLIAPGSVGVYLLIGEGTLQNAIGHSPEAAELRGLVDRRFSLALGDRRSLTQAVRTGIDAVLAEQAARAAAAHTIIEAHLRIVIARLWRAFDVAAGAGNPRSPSERIFNQFNGLVELHFRERWAVQDYAAALGVSRDRLGDICRRVGGGTAKDLVARRTFHESRQLLEHTTHSVEQIAGLLGFSTASHFTRVFRQMAGLPPGRYRQDRAASRNARAQGAALHAWP